MLLWARQLKISQTRTKLGLSCHKTGSYSDKHTENCSARSIKVSQTRQHIDSSCSRNSQFSSPSTNGKEIAFASRKTFRVFAYGEEYARKKSSLVFWLRGGYILRPWHRSKTVRSVDYEVFRSTRENFALQDQFCKQAIAVESKPDACQKHQRHQFDVIPHRSRHFLATARQVQEQKREFKTVWWSR